MSQETPIQRFDALSPELRALANEFGLENVEIFLSWTEDPNEIRGRIKRLIDRTDPTKRVHDPI